MMHPKEQALCLPVMNHIMKNELPSVVDLQDMVANSLKV